MTADAGQPQAGLTCDLTGAADTPAGRLAEYRELFAQSLIGRGETDAGVRFRFQAGPGVADRVRDLAARERGCCGGFLSSTVTVHGPEVWWDLSAADEAAGPVLAEFSRLPDTLAEGDEAVARRFRERGLTVITGAAGHPPA